MADSRVRRIKKHSPCDTYATTSMQLYERCIAGLRKYQPANVFCALWTSECARVHIAVYSSYRYVAQIGQCTLF
jgi:hypothetical protein